MSQNPPIEEAGHGRERRQTTPRSPCGCGVGGTENPTPYDGFDQLPIAGEWRGKAGHKLVDRNP